MIKKRLTRSMRLRLSMESDTDDDNVWLRLVVRVGKLEERFQEEEQLLKELRGGTEKKGGKDNENGPSPDRPSESRKMEGC